MGRFVVIEGIDGAGTTTQAELLAAALAPRGDVVRTNEPTDGPVGRTIRAVLRREEGAASMAALPWMFAADRADHLARTVVPALSHGAWVVSDRYLPSSLAYQSLDRPLDEVDVLNRTFRAPDLTVFVSIDVDTALARVMARGGVREVFEERAALLRVVAQYEVVMGVLASRGWNIVRVDGAAPVEVVQAAVWSAVEALS